jgi:hypothetical protein
MNWKASASSKLANLKIVVRWISPPLNIIIEASNKFFENSFQEIKRKKKELKLKIIILKIKSLHKQ